MSSPFLDKAIAVALYGEVPPWWQVALTFLIDNAQGHKKARPGMDIISRVVEVTGIEHSKNELQNGLIADSRANGYFIGSCHKGFFIIVTPEDAQVMADFYRERIAAEETNLGKLLATATEAGWRQI